jgi:hypothetical protein
VPDANVNAANAGAADAGVRLVSAGVADVGVNAANAGAFGAPWNVRAHSAGPGHEGSVAENGDGGEAYPALGTWVPSPP